MAAVLFLLKVIVVRILIALFVLACLWNPWFSLYQLVAPQGLDWLDWQSVETNWLPKLIAVLVAVGLLIMFLRTTRQAMGLFGLTFVLVILALVAALPFSPPLNWLPPTQQNIGYVSYYFVFPVLLGIGLSTGYITRWLNGTLITKPIIEEHHQTEPGPHSG